MENKKVRKWQIIAILFSIVLGTLLHFVYEWSNQNVIIGAFSAINESIWEHLKLSFYPILLFTIIEYFVIGKNFSTYIVSKLLAAISSIIITTVLFYTYTGIIGEDYFIADIIIFILSIVISEIIAYKIITSNKDYSKFTLTLLIINLIVFVAFVVFTYYPPKINFFRDSVNMTYGIWQLK